MTHPTDTLQGITATSAESAGAPEIAVKIQWLMFFRAVMVTVLLGSTLAVNVNQADLLSDPSTLTLLGLIIGTYALTLVYVFVLRHVEQYTLFAYVQLIIDLVTTSVLIVLTDGVESVFFFMFSLTVINAAILLYRTGAMYVATLAAALLIALFAWETFGLMSGGGPKDGALPRGLLLSGVANLSAVFLVALLSGYLSEQLRDAGQRLRFASEGLQQLRALNENIATSVQSGLVSYTLDGQIIFFNPAAERITGRQSSKVLYRQVDEVFAGVAAHSPKADAPLNRWEEPFVRPDGRTRILGYSLSPLVDGKSAQRGWILIFQDLTPLREMEEVMRRTEKFAAIGKMAAGIAHELRNPLASISGSIQMLNLSENLSEDDSRLSNIVLREIDRLNALITDFLAFARPKIPEFRPFEIGPWLGEIIQIFDNRRLLGGRSVQHRVDLDVEVGLWIRGDADQLEQVMWNLLNNACQAMTKGGEIGVRARSAVGSTGTPTVELQISDDGVGMQSELVAKIFDPFFSTKEDGTGLGLALVHRVVDDHEGVLRVQSAPGEGSTFIVTLPREPNTTSPRSNSSPNNGTSLDTSIAEATRT